MPWLLSRLTVPAYDSNKQYASEVLAVLLQEERGVRMKLADLGGIEPLLLAVSVRAERFLEHLDGSIRKLTCPSSFPVCTAGLP